MQNDKKNEETEKIDEIQEELDFNKPDFTFIPKGVHEWRQEGYFLVCRSCELVHATFLGPDKVIVGEKNGKPIIKKRKEIGMV